MRGRTSTIKISLIQQQRKTLKGLLHRPKTPVGLAKRARAMLLLARWSAVPAHGSTSRIGGGLLNLFIQQFVSYLTQKHTQVCPLVQLYNLLRRC